MCKSSCVFWDSITITNLRWFLFLFLPDSDSDFSPGAAAAETQAVPWSVTRHAGTRAAWQQALFQFGKRSDRILMTSSVYSCCIFFSRNITVTSTGTARFSFQQNPAKLQMDGFVKATIAAERSDKQDAAIMNSYEHEMKLGRGEKKSNLLRNNWKLPLSSATREIFFCCVDKR